MEKRYWILITISLLTIVVQGLFWSQKDMIDLQVWSNEAEYVVNGNELALQGGAYCYPGGPVILGTIAIQKITTMSYENALVTFLIIFNSASIICSYILLYLITKKYWCSLGLFSLLPLSPLFQHSTPTSATSSTLAVVLMLMTLYYITKHNHLTRKNILLWGIVAGILISIRLDIGSIIAFVLGLILFWKNVSIKNVALVLGTSVVTFFIFDPFIWINPLGHIVDMIHRIVFHYYDYGPAYISKMSVLSYSILSIVSVFVTVYASLKFKKEFVPRYFIVSLIIMSVILYYIFMTAHSQALRYFQPIIFMWEALLPCALLFIISKMTFFQTYSEKNQKIIKTVVPTFIFGFLFLNSLLAYYVWWVS